MLLLLLSKSDYKRSSLAFHGSNCPTTGSGTGCLFLLIVFFYVDLEDALLPAFAQLVANSFTFCLNFEDYCSFQDISMQKLVVYAILPT